jgi:hypothetical protein
MIETKRELSSSSGSPRSSGGEEHHAVRQPWTKRTFKTGRRRQPRRSSASRSRASSESLPPLAAVPLLVLTRTLTRKILQPRPPGGAVTAQLRSRSLEEALGEADEYAAIHLADARKLQHDPLAEETLMDALRRAAELETSYYAASLALPLPPRAHWFARRRSRSETGNAELNANAAERRKGSTLNPLAARFTLLSPFQQLTVLSSLILLSSFKQLSLLSSFKQHVGRAGRSRPTRAPSDAGPVPWTCRQVSRTRVRKAACLRHQGSSVPGSHTVWLGFGLTRPWLGSVAQGVRLVETWPQCTVPEATQWVPDSFCMWFSRAGFRGRPGSRHPEWIPGVSRSFPSLPSCHVTALLQGSRPWPLRQRSPAACTASPLHYYLNLASPHLVAKMCVAHCAGYRGNSDPRTDAHLRVLRLRLSADP